MTKDTQQVETLEDADFIERMRLLGVDHEPKGWPAVQMEQITRLCDMYAALLVENERISTALAITGLSDKDRCIAELQCVLQRTDQRLTDSIAYIDKLESQLAALQGGGCHIGTVFFPSHRKAPDVHWESNTPIETGAKLYTTPQPAIAGRVPNGWKIVPIELTAEMVEAVADIDPERASPWAAYLAAAPEYSSAPIAEQVEQVEQVVKRSQFYLAIAEIARQPYWSGYAGHDSQAFQERYNHIVKLADDAMKSPKASAESGPVVSGKDRTTSGAIGQP